MTLFFRFPLVCKVNLNHVAKKIYKVSNLAPISHVKFVNTDISGNRFAHSAIPIFLLASCRHRCALHLDPGDFVRVFDTPWNRLGVLFCLVWFAGGWEVGGVLGGLGGVITFWLLLFEHEHALHAMFPTLHVSWKTFLMLRS